MTAPTDIQEQLRQAIETAPISRYRLSKLSGISQAVISNFVNRKRSATMDTAAKLAAVLGLELRSVKGAGKGTVNRGKSK
jgi:plasmid maintenance system antidote protein VapI